MIIPLFLHNPRKQKKKVTTKEHFFLLHRDLRGSRLRFSLRFRKIKELQVIEASNLNYKKICSKQKSKKKKNSESECMKRQVFEKREGRKKIIIKPVGRQLGRFNIVSECKQHTEKQARRRNGRENDERASLYVFVLWALRDGFWYVRMLFQFLADCECNCCAVGWIE